MIKSLGAISLGVASTSLVKGEVFAEPHKLRKNRLKTEILVVAGGTAEVTSHLPKFHWKISKNLSGSKE